MPRMVSFHVYYCTLITVMLGFIQCMCLVVLIDYYYVVVYMYYYFRLIAEAKAGFYTTVVNTKTKKCIDLY